MIYARKRFIFNWILPKIISIGSAPRCEDDVNFLKSKKIKSILCLCSQEEFEDVNKLNENFKFRRTILPDHKSNSIMSKGQIINALNELNLLKKGGNSIFVHCNAGVERSPTVILSYLIYSEGYDFYIALKYLMDVHPYSNPLTFQIDLVRNLYS